MGSWGQKETVRQIIHSEIEELFEAVDARNEALKNLTPDQKDRLRALVADLEAGVEPWGNESQWALAKLIRIVVRQ